VTCSRACRTVLRQPNLRAHGRAAPTGLFSSAGELSLVREDVGRHNAMDKVIGAALRAGASAV